MSNMASAMSPILLNGLGLHGVKRQWSTDVVTRGLTRDDSACFLWLPALTARKGSASHRSGWQQYLAATLTLCVYFALSLSTLRRVQESSWCSWYECLAEHPEWIPEIVLFHLPAATTDDQSLHACSQRYYSFLPMAQGWSLVYTKVTQYPHLRFAMPEVVPLTVSLETIRLAEEEARDILATWHLPSVEVKLWPRFFCKGEKLSEEYATAASFWESISQSYPEIENRRKLHGLADPRLVALFCHRLANHYFTFLAEHLVMRLQLTCNNYPIQPVKSEAQSV